MDNQFTKRDIRQLNDSIKVMSSPAIALMSTILFVVVSLTVWVFVGSVTEKAHVKGMIFPAGGTTDVCIPQAGVVRSMFVRKGQQVTAGQHIAMVSVGSAYSVLVSSVDGVVFNCLQNNEAFDAFAPVATLIVEDGGEGGMMLMAYSGIDDIKDIAVGQQVQVWPHNENKDEVGFVRGRIASVGRLPVDREDAARRIKVPEFIDELVPEAVISYEVEIYLNESEQHPGQLDWTFERDDHPSMGIGTLCDAIVITHTYSIFEYLFLKARVASNKVKTRID